MNDDERQAMVASCRYVDEVIGDFPYVITPEWIDELFEKRGIDILVHGEDDVIINGQDVYGKVKEMGKYRTVMRTECISTTNLAGRVELASVEHHMRAEDEAQGRISEVDVPIATTPAAWGSTSLLTTQLLGIFQAGVQQATHFKADDRVVYIDGAWDFFHPGHVSVLKRVRGLGNKVIVGVHSDRTVNEHWGHTYPIMTMHERTLGLLGCRYVDDVLFDAPWIITQELISSLNATVVVQGVSYGVDRVEPEDPYLLPKAMGIFHDIEIDCSLTVADLFSRMKANALSLAERRNRESAWYRQKHGIKLREPPG
eukprot:NODE_12617_length_1213_cov_6.529466.p1 GENE.NODE_12617_length_1213_cov_6.529466~~NODE_12617_length_1213_cov_6.529466.p1  ORF type:complete len:313 (+),score=83.54 NODE_12617_length_1213_cov_6.529466:2-940(+)